MQFLLIEEGQEVCDCGLFLVPLRLSTCEKNDFGLKGHWQIFDLVYVLVHIHLLKVNKTNKQKKTGCNIMAFFVALVEKIHFIAKSIN